MSRTSLKTALSVPGYHFLYEEQAHSLTIGYEVGPSGPMSSGAMSFGGFSHRDVLLKAAEKFPDALVHLQRLADMLEIEDNYEVDYIILSRILHSPLKIVRTDWSFVPVTGIDIGINRGGSEILIVTSTPPYWGDYISTSDTEGTKLELLYILKSVICAAQLKLDPQGVIDEAWPVIQKRLVDIWQENGEANG